MAQFSFDVVSDYDNSEINNVFDQVKRELANRYDFKGTSASLEWLDNDKSGLKVIGDSQYQIEAILEIVRKTLAKRGLSQKVIDGSKEPTTSNLKVTLEVPFVKGLGQDKAKKITSCLKADLPKLKTQIQGDEVRVSSSSKNDLQQAIQLLKEKDFDFPVQFTNFR